MNIEIDYRTEWTHSLRLIYYCWIQSRSYTYRILIAQMYILFLLQYIKFRIMGGLHRDRRGAQK